MSAAKCMSYVGAWLERRGKPVLVLTQDTPITQLGLDSLEWAELILDLEDAMSVEFPVDTISEAETMGAVLDQIDWPD